MWYLDLFQRAAAVRFGSGEAFIEESVVRRELFGTWAWGHLPRVDPNLVERRPFATPQGRTIFASTTLSAQHAGYMDTCDPIWFAIGQTAFAFLAKQWAASRLPCIVKPRGKL